MGCFCGSSSGISNGNDIGNDSKNFKMTSDFASALNDTQFKLLLNDKNHDDERNVFRNCESADIWEEETEKGNKRFLKLNCVNSEFLTALNTNINKINKKEFRTYNEESIVRSLKEKLNSRTVKEHLSTRGQSLLPQFIDDLGCDVDRVNGVITCSVKQNKFSNFDTILQAIASNEKDVREFPIMSPPMQGNFRH